VPYRIRTSTEATRDLRSLPGHIRQRALRTINTLADNPRPAGTKELRGLPGVFRLRLERWRIIYRVDDDDNVLSLIRVLRKTGPETYENLPPS
jgi:mRNA interferase RelE/StbE